jgi:hypothetical protein
MSGFTVTEGGNDYAAHQNIPVTGLQLYNGLLPGEVYNQPIIQGNDLLDARELTIDLIQEEFEAAAILDESHFSFENGPAGLTIESVSRISSVSASILLQFDNTDFDDNIPGFHVLIDHTVLVTSTQDLATNSLNILAIRDKQC